MKTTQSALVCRRLLLAAVCLFIAPALLEQALFGQAQVEQETEPSPAAAVEAAAAAEVEPKPGQPAAAQKAPRAPLPPPGTMAACKKLIDRGLFGGARARLQPILEQHPNWARARLLMGLTYYRESRFEAANEHFAKALEANPGELAVRPFYGWSLYSLGELDAAEQMFESILKPKPDYTAAHYALGMIDLDRDEVEAARAHFDTTIRLGKQQQDEIIQGRGHGRIGDLLLRLGELEGAKEALTRAIELFPDDHNAHFTLSRVLQRLGDEAGAEAARETFEALKAKLRPGKTQFPGG